MSILDKLFVKEPSKTAQAFAEGPEMKQKNQILEAKVKLEEARNTNETVINLELNKIRRNRKEKLNSAASEERSFTKIKKAYYAMMAIDETRMRINDMETTRELFGALNDLTDAVSIINNVYRNSKKPSTARYEKETEQLKKNEEDADKRVSNLHAKVSGIDDLVSNDVVENLLKGNTVDQCLRAESGIQIPVENLLDFDLDELDNLPDGMDSNKDNNAGENEDFDFSKLDFSGDFGDF